MSIGEVRANYVNANDVYSAKKTSYTQEYRQILEKKVDEQAEVIRDGGINPSFQMGGDSYTTEEWDEFFKENEIQIERIWSDQEIEQGYLNN